MSAFVCSDEHLNYLISAWQKYSGEQENFHSLPPAALARMLRDENVRSVDFRYSDGESSAEPFVGPLRRVSVDPITVLSAVACYEYQSCEHPTWQESTAAAFCRALTAYAHDKLPGYQDAPWHITEWQPKLLGQRAFVPLADAILGQTTDLQEYGEHELRERLLQIRDLVRRAQSRFGGQ